MSSPALALTPVPVSSGTGAGANIGAADLSDHRHHTLCENTDGNGRAGNRGASRAFTGRERPASPLPPHRRTARQHMDRGGA
jgi:hypothetical protein